MLRLKCFFSVHVGNDGKMSEYTRLESREAGHEGIKMEAREHYCVIEGRGKRARDCVGRDADTEDCS